MKNTITFENFTNFNVEYQVKDILGIFNGQMLNVRLDEDKGYLVFSFVEEDKKEEFLRVNICDDIKQLRKKVKFKLYSVLSERFSKKSPWGILTGIRPTKLANELLLLNTPEKAIDILCENYLLSRDKAELAVQVALAESNILNSEKETDASLYIGIPYCPSICAYCSFSSYPINSRNSNPSEYIMALINHLRIMKEKILSDGKCITDIYVGGGTPTSLSSDLLNVFLDELVKIFDMSAVKEFTVEAGRPDSITFEKLQVLKAHNVNRISINPQTMNDKTLELIGRNHSNNDVQRIFDLAQKFNFDTINMDLIAGLPGEKLEDFIYSLEKIIELNPENITVHALAMKRASKLSKTNISNDSAESEDCIKMFLTLYEHMKANEYFPYYMYRQKNISGNQENIGYSKMGHECRYNVHIIEEKQSIYACGAGGVTKIYYPESDRLERIPNLKDPKLYIEKFME